MGPSVWVVPVDAAPSRLARSVALLARQRADPELVRAMQVVDRLHHEVPRAAVVHGGALTPLLMDVQRWLADAGVPTLVLLEDRTGHYGGVLRDRGAVDVLSLPVSRRTLGATLARMSRVTGTPSPPERPAPPVTVGELTIRPAARVVTVGRFEISLTRTEFDLLLVLATRQGTVVTRAELGRSVGPRTISSRALETHVSRLRAKLSRAGVGLAIRPVRNVGYLLGSDPAGPGSSAWPATSARS